MSVGKWWLGISVGGSLWSTTSRRPWWEGSYTEPAEEGGYAGVEAMRLTNATAVHSGCVGNAYMLTAIRRRGVELSAGRQLWCVHGRCLSALWGQASMLTRGRAGDNSEGQGTEVVTWREATSWAERWHHSQRRQIRPHKGDQMHLVFAQGNRTILVNSDS